MKSNKLKFVLIPISIVIVALLAVVFFLLKDKDDTSKSVNEDVAVEDEASYKENEVADSGDSFYKAYSKCAGCGQAIQTLNELQEEINSFGYNEATVKNLTDKKYQEMCHDCMADVIYVENYPYVYRNAFGVYTGDWKGAGPYGQGSFSGTVPLTEETITYTGEWKYGLPDGQGELFLGARPNRGELDRRYIGQMRVGLREGKGLLYETVISLTNAYPSKYKVYEESDFVNDTLAKVTYAEEYDMATDEVIMYYEMIGSENGYSNVVNSWRPGELSPEQQKIVDGVIIVAGTAICSYIIYDMIKDSREWKAQYDASRVTSHQEMISWLNKCEEEERAADEKRRADKEASEKKFMDDSWDYYNQIKDDPYVPQSEKDRAYDNSYWYE